MPDNDLRIYFIGGPDTGPPRRARVYRWLIKKLTGSPLYHVAVGLHDVIMAPTLTGVLFHTRDAYERLAPGLVAVVRVPCRHRIDLGWFDRFVGRPIPAAPTVIRWLRRGRGPLVNDCVGHALRCLHAAGVEDIPTDIVSPVQLIQALTQRGYPCQLIRRPATARCRTTAPA